MVLSQKVRKRLSRLAKQRPRDAKGRFLPSRVKRRVNRVKVVKGKPRKPVVGKTKRISKKVEKKKPFLSKDDQQRRELKKLTRSKKQKFITNQGFEYRLQEELRSIQLKLELSSKQTFDVVNQINKRLKRENFVQAAIILDRYPEKAKAILKSFPMTSRFRKMVVDRL